MKPIKQIYKDLLAFWEEKFKDREFRTGVICIIISVVLFALTWCLALIPSHAVPVDGGTYPSDLTGYTVTVPAGWTATAGYGSFTLEGTFYTEQYEASSNLGVIYIGFYDDFGDRLPYANTVQLAGYTLTNTLYSFTLNITGGYAVTDPSLIQWLVNNNATFTLTTPDEPDEPDEPTPLATFRKGLYRVNPLWYNTSITTQLDGMEFYSLNEGTTYTALTVQNNELVFDDENLETLTVARKGTTGVIWLDNSGQFVYYTNDESIPQSLADQIPTLLEYIPDVTLEDFQRMQDSWYYGVQDGFIASEQNYEAGYEAGFDAGVENSGGNFFGNFIESILNALDKLVILPGNISILDILKAACGIFAVVWLLKLLAGG